MPRQMSREQRAAYMRDYRLRKKREADPERLAVEAAGLRTMLGEADSEFVRVLRPSFLAAPNDDCAACGHDRQQFHVTGPCTAPNGRRRCSCPDFVAVLFDD